MFLLLIVMAVLAVIVEFVYGNIGVGLFFFACEVITLLPSIIAFARRNESRWLILLLNVTLFWTGVIWFILIAWALSRNNWRYNGYVGPG